MLYDLHRLILLPHYNLTDEDSFDNRSDARGAEPEGLVLAEIDDK